MSILNGIAGLSSGLSSFARMTADDMAEQKANTADAAQQRSLLNTVAPPPPDAPAAPAAAQEHAPAAVQEHAAEAGAANAAKGALAVPDALLPIYQAASKRTHIPIDVLIAHGKQESNFNADAVGSAGEIGIHQIKPSTAVSPGYGMKGIDPATLKDPAVNINFAADYLAARAGHPNFNDPAAVDAALKAYNGGGDPNYVANVRRYMGGTS